jgi:two-component system phosphate regulon sensor histidine kinase PhoR
LVSENPAAGESIPLRRQAVDVGVLLELTTEVMQRQARSLGITLTLRIDDDVPSTVRLDRDKVAWAITSLVGSALRHVHGSDRRVDVHVAWNAARSTLVVGVRDNGPGMSSDHLSMLFKRDAWHPGSALALLLVEDIATAHGGGITVKSSTDPAEHFTDVRFTIPVDRIMQD